MALILFLVCAFARGEVKNFLASPVLVSGTLKPLTVAINGQKILSLDEEKHSLLINDQLITSEKNDPHRSFFYKLQADQINIADSNKQLLLSVSLPRLTALTDNDNRLEVFVAPANLIVTVDDKVFDQGQDHFTAVEINQPNDPWFTSEHTLILKDPSTMIERFYVFENTYEWPAQELRRFGLAICETPISLGDVDAGFVASYDSINPKHWLLGGRIIIPFHRDYSYSTSDGYILQIRYGRQFFRKANTPGAAVWFEGGVGAQYAAFEVTDYGQKTVVRASTPYFYLSTLPLVFKSYQFGVTMQGGPRAHRNIPNFHMEAAITKEW